MDLLEVSDVTCGYGDDPVLRDVSFSLDKPEYVCVIGPNGVGKSTLIKLIDGLVKPTSGTVSVFGKDVSEYSLKELSRLIGYVPVTSNDYSSMPVLDTVLVGRYSLQGWRTKSDDISAAVRALKAMGVDDLVDRRFDELSAGQRQKVSIARGLVQEPKMLMLDEPTANLDIRHQVYVSAFLRSLTDKVGMTCFTVSHDLNLAAKHATKVVVLQRPGVVYDIGRPDEVITERMVRDVYGVCCDIVDDHGAPHVMLQDVLPCDLSGI